MSGTWFTTGNRHRKSLAAVLLLPLVAVPLAAQHRGGIMGGMGAPRMGGMRHDSTAMAHMAVIHELVMNHDRITRSITNLQNGVRTVTESGDSLLARRIKEHVVTMNARIVSGSDPSWPMESEALRTLYKNSAMIQTRIDSTPKGIVVEQTSTDSATVAALQTHATEVSELVRGGREAMHAAMMKNRGSMMMHGPHGPASSDSAARRPPGPPAHVHRPPGSR